MEYVIIKLPRKTNIVDSFKKITAPNQTVSIPFPLFITQISYALTASRINPI